MGFEYSLKGKTLNAYQIINMLEKEWRSIISSGTGHKAFQGIGDMNLVDSLTRCWVLKGANGFSFLDMDPGVEVGWHEIIMLSTKNDDGDEPYIYILSWAGGAVLNLFLDLTKELMESHKIDFEIKEM